MLLEGLISQPPAGASPASVSIDRRTVLRGALFGAADYLRRVFGMLREAGFDYYKIDFGYAGALPGPRHSGAGPLAAYRDGVRLIREAIGSDRAGLAARPVVG